MSLRGHTMLRHLNRQCHSDHSQRHGSQRSSVSSPCGGPVMVGVWPPISGHESEGTGHRTGTEEHSCSVLRIARLMDGRVKPGHDKVYQTALRNDRK